MAQLGFEANFKVGFVLASWFLIRYIWLTKSPTDAKPRDVSGQFAPKRQNIVNKNITNKSLAKTKYKLKNFAEKFKIKTEKFQPKIRHKNAESKPKKLNQKFAIKIQNLNRKSTTKNSP